MLELKNISLSFKEKKILEDVSFSVNKGEIMLLSGKSGAGKSTILRIIANLISIDSGQLWFDRKLETQASLQENNCVGIVFQNFNLFKPRVCPASHCPSSTLSIPASITRLIYAALFSPIAIIATVIGEREIPKTGKKRNKPIT